MSTSAHSDHGAPAPTGTASTRTLLPCAGVLFDCDGVLVDSEDAVHASWTQWCQALCLDPGPVLATIHGRRARDTVAHFVPKEQRAWASELIDAIELTHAVAVTAIPGARQLFESVPAHRRAIVTSGSRVLAIARLRAAGIPIPDVLVAADDVRHGKPSPEGYLQAAYRLGLRPRDCVVVEDAAVGVAAARSARVRSVLGVGAKDFGLAHPNVVVPNLTSVRWHPAGLLVSPGR